MAAVPTVRRWLQSLSACLPPDCVLPAGPPVAAWERFAIAGLTLAAAALRLQLLPACGLSHFDEGIYAISGEWPWTGRFHPQQAFHSPPALPFLIGLAYCVAGRPIDWVALWPSVAASILLVPVAWSIARRWWSPAAGVAAAAMLAVDRLHIVFARSALTDPLFVLFFLLALDRTRSAVALGGWRRIAAAGLWAALAWNTKYNGLMPVLLMAGACLDGPWRQLPRRLARWLLVVAVAAAGYLPWALQFHMEQPGGYATLLKHQAGYVLGMEAIPAGQWLALTQWLSVAAFPAGAMLCLAAAVVAIAGRAAGRGGWGWTGALVGGLLLPGAYYPYLRLWLPTETLLVLAAAAVAGAMAQSAPRLLATGWASVLAAASLLSLVSPQAADPPLRAPSPPPAAGYRPAPYLLDPFVPSDEKRPLLYLFARPPLQFYLRHHNWETRLLAGFPEDLRRLPGQKRRLLVDLAQRDPPEFWSAMERAWRRSELFPEAGSSTRRNTWRNGRIEQLASGMPTAKRGIYPYEPSLPTQLDDRFAPADAENAYQVEVYDIVDP